MYTFNVPLAEGIREDNIGELLTRLKEAQTDRVFFTFNTVLSDPDTLEKEIEKFRKKAAPFRENGIKVGIWIYPTLGYGNPAGAMTLGKNTNFTRKRMLFVRSKDNYLQKKQKYVYGAFCPADKNFAKAFAQFVAVMAKETDLIIFEDDFSISGIDLLEMCCCCRLHMKEFNRRVGGNFTPEQLAEKIYEEGPNEYRDAWYRLKRDTMLDFLKTVRDAVDEVSPATRIGLCAHNSSFDLNGASLEEQAKTIAGNTKPFVRLSGAPYWEVATLGTNIETARLTAHWMDGTGVETISEGDTYPRPRYRVPANSLESFDMILRADGKADGILKYMLEYSSDVLYEKGYIERHTRNLPVYRLIDRLFKGKEDAGVNLYEKQRKIGQYVFDETEPFEVSAPYLIFDTVIPTALVMAKDNSLPTAFGAEGYANFVFGENARDIDPEILKNGAVLDFKAAKILAERGIDVGFDGYSRMKKPNSEYFCERKDSVLVETPNADHSGQFFFMHLKKGAVTDSIFGYKRNKVSLFYGAEYAEETFPACYRYENKSGMRFVVYSFTASTVQVRQIFSPWSTGLFRNYYRQKQLIDGIEWAQKKRLPATCAGNPDLYILCKKKGNSMAVGLWNLCNDSIYDARIRLDAEYTRAQVYYNEGTLCGDELCLAKEIPPYGFTFFTVEIETDK